MICCLSLFLIGEEIKIKTEAEIEIKTNIGTRLGSLV